MLDVLVVGGGNAALVRRADGARGRRVGAAARIRTARDGAAATRRHTRNLRCMHDAPRTCSPTLIPKRSTGRTCSKVTGGQTDERLARMVIRASGELPGLDAHAMACSFQPPLPARCMSRAPTPSSSGGGKALINAYYRSAERLGVTSGTNAPVEAISSSTTAASLPRRHCATARADRRASLRVAAGGFESNLRVAARSWGERRASGRRQLPHPRHALQYRA